MHLNVTGTTNITKVPNNRFLELDLEVSNYHDYATSKLLMDRTQLCRTMTNSEFEESRFVYAYMLPKQWNRVIKKGSMWQINGAVLVLIKLTNFQKNRISKNFRTVEQN